MPSFQSPGHRFLTRGRVVTAGLLVAVLAGAALVPHGSEHRPSAVQSADRRSAAPDLAGATAGWGSVSPAMRAQINALVSADKATARSVPLGRMSAPRAAASLVRCVNLEGQRYCLGIGWTQQSPAALRRQYAAAATRDLARSTSTGSTGALDVLGIVQRTAAMSPEQRAASDRAELLQAARSVAKVWLIRHQVQGTPLPAGFLRQHPEVQLAPRPAAPAARTAATATATASTTPSATASSSPSPSTAPAVATSSAAAAGSPTASPAATTSTSTKKWIPDYPRFAMVLNRHQTTEQTTYWYCGPTAMQMIAWGWTKREQSQNYWAGKLHTTSNGTAMSDMVRVTNRYTGWGGRKFAGPYVTLSIRGFSYKKWELLIMHHIVDYHAPVIFNPILKKQWFPYIDHDLSGHFQVGRGYNKRGGRPDYVSYFEPYNQQRFDPSLPFINRVQWRPAYWSFRAQEANFAQIGV